MNQPFKTRYVTYLTAVLLLAPLAAAAQDEAGFYASAYGGVPAAPSTSLSEFRPTGPGVGARPSLVAVSASVLPRAVGSATGGPSSWRGTSVAIISGASVASQSMAISFPNWSC
jgi:hypothetical protein